MPVNGAFTIVVEQHDAGQRLDTAVASRLSACSRSLAATLISRELILVNQQPKKPGYRVRSGDRVVGHIPAAEPVDYRPEPIPLNIRYQDNHIIVIDKQPGMVVHPAPGHRSGTLVNALLYHCPDLGAIGGEIRPGIVHRLDKDTSGIMVVAKDSESQEELARQFKAREVEKKYLALVFGEVESETGEIQLPIGRHPVDRKRMSTTTRKGRAALTAWTVRERLNGITLLELNLKTGRTHQIRVHCSAIGHPVVEDPVYRSRNSIKNLKNKLAGRSASIITAIESAERQQLHAWQLGLTHPKSGEYMTFEAPLPPDMQDLIDKLKAEM
ncbi:LSU rRNA pseudouridine(1911/1915/1917) synthase (EC [Olavius algarvensis Delta 1 endosymbiont]|nr:LSU rRNA pseudouridine(1911/1915/1917) synthase (EC [Olavius algarvensis Delta 1 endosymbiont]